MQLETRIEGDRVEFRGKPKSMVFLFAVFSLMAIAISSAGAWYTWNSAYRPTPAAAPLIAAIFVAAPLVAIAGLFFAMRKEFRAMSVNAADGTVTLTWMHLFGDRTEVLSLDDVSKFNLNYVPQSNRSSGWQVEIHFKNGSRMETGKFDEEGTARQAVEAANGLVAKQ